MTGRITRDSISIVSVKPDENLVGPEFLAELGICVGDIVAFYKGTFVTCLRPCAANSLFYVCVMVAKGSGFACVDVDTREVDQSLEWTERIARMEEVCRVAASNYAACGEMQVQLPGFCNLGFVFVNARVA